MKKYSWILWIVVIAGLGGLIYFAWTKMNAAKHKQPGKPTPPPAKPTASPTVTAVQSQPTDTPSDQLNPGGMWQTLMSGVSFDGWCGPICRRRRRNQAAQDDTAAPVANAAVVPSDSPAEVAPKPVDDPADSPFATSALYSNLSEAE